MLQSPLFQHDKSSRNVRVLYGEVVSGARRVELDLLHGKEAPPTRYLQFEYKHPSNQGKA